MIKRGRKAQLFGMPFSTIFSIFLIAVFIVVAFFAIKYFLDIKKCSETGLFLDDLQDAVDSAWQSYSTSKTFSRNLPSAIEYVCFADLAEDATGDAKEKEIYKELRKNAVFANNLFFYPQKAAAGCLASTKINHLASPETNPYCIPVVDGKVEMKIEYTGSLVKVSRA